MRASREMMLVLVALSAACHCAQVDEMDTDFASSTSDTSTESSSSSSESSSGDPFDASRWLGRYHYESIRLPFGELGDPDGPYKLVNFEIFADSRAELFYDACSFEKPIVISYEWEPDEQGWLRLRPGIGEPSLRFEAAENLKSLRVLMVDECRQLKFEIDGVIDDWLPFRPGESCWVVRCTVPNLMQVDYCEGEEPPACP